MLASRMEELVTKVESMDNDLPESSSKRDAANKQVIEEDSNPYLRVLSR